MNALWPLINLVVFLQTVKCRDFYLGMFRRNDFLVAQDVIYKAPAPFGYTTASYGRLFKCPITYFRVVDRLGMGRGPITTIVRGGLRKKFIAVRIKSTYTLPISVNIYVGCENKKPSTFRTTTKLATTHPTTMEPAGGSDNFATTISDATAISGDFSGVNVTATTAGKDATNENEAATTDDTPSVATEGGSETTSSDVELSETNTDETTTGETDTEEKNTEEPTTEE